MVFFKKPKKKAAHVVKTHAAKRLTQVVKQTQS
jgi:hypothetical protein